MSYRSIPSQGEELKRFLQELSDRVQRLDEGGALAGQISLNSVIQIGDVLVSVTDAGGTSRNLVFTNTLSGASYTINL